jgi:hypothetical protein
MGADAMTKTTLPDDAYYAALCYVERPFAYFTRRPLSDEDGDDWGKTNYHDNASRPHGYDETDEQGRPYCYRVAWDADELVTAKDVGGYSDRSPSVRSINAGAVAWIATSPYSDDEIIAIPAGTTLRDFFGLIAKAGGTVYVQSEIAQ